MAGLRTQGSHSEQSGCLLQDSEWSPDPGTRPGWENAADAAADPFRDSRCPLSVERFIACN